MARKSKYQVWREEHEARQQALCDAANDEIQSGRATYTYGPGLQPAGRTVKRFYMGVPGIWSIDDHDNHWCCDPDRTVRTVNYDVVPHATH